jgi:hypothetical protein
MWPGYRLGDRGSGLNSKQGQEICLNLLKRGVVQREPTFRRNNLHPSSYSKNKLASAGFLLGFLFDTEDGGDMFIRNEGSLRNTRCYNSEDGSVHNHRPQTLKFNWKEVFIFSGASKPALEVTTYPMDTGVTLLEVKAGGV